MKTKVKWLLPWLVIGAFAPFSPSLDLFFSHYFFDGNHFYNPIIFHWLFTYGELFGFIVASIVLMALLFSFKIQMLKRYRPCFLAFLLTIVLGAGAITNLLLKGYWGRPRPKQIVEFGGKNLYRPYYRPDFATKEPQRSFPSGHVAMAACFVSLCLSARRYKSRLFFILALTTTLFLTLGLMVARVAQGGHFFSDVTFSVALIWCVALLADQLCFKSVKL